MNNEKEFKPYIPADKVLPELTPISIILGILLAKGMFRKHFEKAGIL